MITKEQALDALNLVQRVGRFSEESEFLNPLRRYIEQSTAQQQAKALEGVQTFEFVPPPYHSEAMGCGLEDMGIRGRYEAMSYGWEKAMDRAAESVPGDLVRAATVAALQARIAELDAQVASLVADIAHADSLLSAGNDKGALVQVRSASTRATKSYLDSVGRAAIAAARKESK